MVVHVTLSELVKDVLWAGNLHNSIDAAIISSPSVTFIVMCLGSECG